jgi:predicted Zn-dependent protease
MANAEKDRCRVRAAMEPAQGFYDLGLFCDAWDALDELPPEDRADPLVVALRLDILLSMNRLVDAVALGTGACRQWPSVGGFFLKTGSALIVLGDHEKAKGLLLAAPPSAQTKAAYWYDLARCQGRTDDVDAARKSLWECINRDKGFRARALDDPDLDAVWASL